MPEADEQQYSVSRLVAFSDGVFGFAITLLITTIPFSLAGLSPSPGTEQVEQHLLSLWPYLYSYILSFYIIGYYWIIHHRIFQRIIKIDTSLLWLNFTLLLFIVFLPVPTSFMSRYRDSAIITALYAAMQVLIWLAYVSISWYAFSYRRLTLPSLNQKATRHAELRALITLAIFALSIGLAFINPWLAKLAWITIFFIPPIVLSKYKRQES